MSSIEVRVLTPTIGAEISGVDLRNPLPPGDVERIERALLDHLVIFFRDQDITPAQQVAFGRQFAELCFLPFMTQHGDDPGLLIIDQVRPKGEGTDTWHSDNSFMAEPPLGSILKAVQVPPVGGDTCFASSYAAYEALSPAIRDFLEVGHFTASDPRLLRLDLIRPPDHFDVHVGDDRLQRDRGVRRKRA